MERTPRGVVVVGAGLAGLAAAWRLSGSGHRVSLFERAPQAGGRAAPARLAGRAVDPIAAAVSPADARLLALLRESGLEGEFLPLAPWAGVQLSAGQLVPVAAPGVRAVARLRGVRPLEALRLLRLPRLLRRYAKHLDAARPELAAPLDDRSLRDFGELYFGRSVVEQWIEPWLAERTPVDERDASRALFLRRFAAEGDTASGALREPVGLFAELVAARLGARTGVTVERLEPGAAQRIDVRIEGSSVVADAVVVATQSGEARRIAAALLTTAERDALAAVDYDAAITWMGGARGALGKGPTRVRVPRAAGAPFSALVVEGGRATAIARAPWAAQRLGAGDDALGAEIAAALARCLPGLEAVAAPGLLHRFPLAWPRFDVGRHRALARLRAVQEDRRRAGRRLYLAGDYLAAPTLEGAVASGLRAADDVLADLRA